MNKIKFQSKNKYKGIVEKIFVSPGQPVIENENLAEINTQYETIIITAPCDGIIRDINIVESLIVRPGEVIFEILDSKNVDKLLKKPNKIESTLKEGLMNFGILNNSSNKNTKYFEEKTESDIDNKELFSETNTSTIIDFDKINQSTKSFFTDDISISKELEDNDAPIFIEKEYLNKKTNKTETFEQEDNNTKKPTIDFSSIFDDNRTSNVSSSKTHEMINNQSSGDLLKTKDLAEEIVDERKDNNIENKKIVDDFIFDKKPNNNYYKNNEVNYKNLKGNEVNNTVNLDKIKYLIKNEINKLSNEWNAKSSVLKDDIEDQNIENLSLLKKKIKQIEINNENILNKLDLIKEYDDSEIRAEIKKILLKQNELNENTRNIFNKEENFLATKRNDVSSIQNNLSSLSFEVDITGLLNLHALMYDPYKAKGIDLKLSTFYLKALCLVLNKFSNYNSDEKQKISFGQIQNNQITFKNIKIQEENSIFEVANLIQKEQTTKKTKNIVLYDLSEYDVLFSNSNFNLSEKCLISLIIGDVQYKVKTEETFSSYVIVTITFNFDVISIEDAVNLTKKFNEIITNPGILI